MEPLPQRSLAQRPETAPERQRPSAKNKVERIGSQTKGLFEDFTAWIELRLKLFQIEVQQKIQTKLSETAIKVAPFVAGSIAGLFALVTLALFVGWWLGHPAWGFLTVTGLLLTITGVLFGKSKRLGRESEASSGGSSSNGQTAGGDSE